MKFKVGQKVKVIGSLSKEPLTVARQDKDTYLVIIGEIAGWLHVDKLMDYEEWKRQQEFEEYFEEMLTKD